MGASLPQDLTETENAHRILSGHHKVQGHWSSLNLVISADQIDTDLAWIEHRFGEVVPKQKGEGPMIDTLLDAGPSRCGKTLLTLAIVLLFTGAAVNSASAQAIKTLEP